MISVLFGALLTLSASAVGDAKAEQMLTEYGQKLSSLNSLQVQIEAFRGGENHGKASLTLARPSYARIERAGRIKVLDAKNCSEFFASKNQYYTRSLRSGELAESLSDDLFLAWSPFFEEESKTLARMKKSATYVGSETIEGSKYDCVKVVLDQTAGKTMKLYIDPSDGLAKHAEIAIGSAKEKAPLLILSDNFDTEPLIDLKAVFAMPKGAQMVAEADLVGARWYYDFDEALAVAKSSNRLMMVDFYTDWCGWCKKLDSDVFSTQKFMEAARTFVLVKINAEKGKGVSLAQKYNVNSFPRIVFVDKNGEVVHEVSGYMPLDPFLAEMRKAQGG
ncbi:MAG: thioredoxin family protein [Fimbriimonadia bacterium]